MHPLNGNKLNEFFAFFSIQNNDPIHVIAIADERRREKPPDYDSVTSLPPSYDEALKQLDPSALMSQPMFISSPASPAGATNNAFTMSSESSSRPGSSSYASTLFINKKLTANSPNIDVEKNDPPPYTIAPS